MTLTELGEEAAAAAQVMVEAARLTRTIRVGAHDVDAKADESPVTIADFAVQGLVSLRLTSLFPEDPLVAEEDAEELRREAAARLRARIVDVVRPFEPGLAEQEQLLAAIDRGRGTPGERYWTLDPVDGTKGLLRGGQYVVALALLVRGAVVAAAIGCPRLALTCTAGPEIGGVAVAARGSGSWWLPLSGGPMVRLQVSGRSMPADARVADSVETAHSDRSRQHRLLEAMGCRAEPLLMDSQAKHVAVAAGEADVLVRFPRSGYQEAIWDQAPGTLIVQEAGGRVTDLTGRPFDFSTGRRLARNEGVLATNGRLHDSALAAVSVALREGHEGH